MSEEISWDDVDAVRSGTYEPVSVATVIDWDEVPSGPVTLRANYETAWLGWFTVDRTARGQSGACLQRSPDGSPCPYTVFVPFGRVNDAGALGRARIDMERHCYAVHVEHTMRTVLNAVPFDFSGDPPY